MRLDYFTSSCHIAMVEILDEWVTIQESTDVIGVLVDECANEMETKNLLGLNADGDADGEESDDEKKYACGIF